MLGAIGISIVIGILFRVFHAVVLSNVFFGIAASVALLLLILLLIEQQQDKVMNDEAIEATK